jgi:hypothetical protein
VKPFIVAEDDMMVQFGTRELIWPGGAFSASRHRGDGNPRRGPPYRLVEGRIAERWAIRDYLTIFGNSAPDRRS